MNYVEALFKEFNRQYFRSEIPVLAVSYARNHVNEWAYFDNRGELGRIVLSPVLKEYQLATEGIMIHEIIHAFLWNKYYIKEGRDDSNSFLWMEHTREFKNIERVINKRHFGNPRGHAHYFNLMIKNLDNR